MSVYVERLARIQHGAQLSREDVARIVGASVRTVARWASGTNTPKGASRDRLLQLAAVAQQLSKTMSPDAASAWLHEPNPLLSNQRPIDLVTQGRYGEVLDLIDSIADGVFV